MAHNTRAMDGQRAALQMAETMGDRLATVASGKLGIPLRFVGWFKQHPSGATEPQFAVAREHALVAFNAGLCIQVEG